MSAAPIENTPDSGASSSATKSAAPAAPAPAPFQFAEKAAKTGEAPTPGSKQDAPTKAETITLAPWMGELDADGAAYVKGKGWLAEGKSFADVVKAHRAAESFIGKPADQVMAKPNWSNPESVAEYRKAIGVPETPEGYKSDGVKLPDGVIDRAQVAAISHDLSLSQAQHEQLLVKTYETFSTAIESHAKEVELRNAAELVEQDKSWGAAKAEKLQAIQEAITANNISAETYEALCISMGTANTREFLSGLTERYAEHRSPAGSDGKAGFKVTTPEVARAEIARLGKDAAFKADQEAGGARAAAATERLNRLHKIAWSDS